MNLLSLTSPLSLCYCSFPAVTTLPTFPSLYKCTSGAVLRRCVKGEKEEELLQGMPKEYYDDEWQAQQRKKTKELQRRRRQEEEEEERKMGEYREIGLRLKEYPEEDVIKARKLVASFLKVPEEVEERIEEAAEKGELTELVLMVIWNRLDLARRDEEKDAIRSLDLLYRRAETEILKREATPAMRLLNDLLIMYDGHDFEVWLKKCKKVMIDAFPHEDPFSILVPPGLESFDIDKHHEPLRPSLEDDETLLRVDFVREVDELLREVRSEKSEVQNESGLTTIAFPNSSCEVPRPPHNPNSKGLCMFSTPMSELELELDVHARPPFLLQRPPLLQSAPPLFKQRSWSPDAYRDEAWLRRKGNWKNRRSKSVTDEDVDELKACIELGFGFDSSPEVELDPRLSDTLPALGLYHAVNKHYNESLVPKTTTTPSSSAASDCEGTPSPHGSPHSAIFTTGDNPQTVKTRLRQWAQVVGCAVRQSSS